MQETDRKGPGFTQSVSQDVSISISAWMDGDGETIMPDAVFTEGGEQTWRVYHLIGDALRTPELIRPVSAQFRERLSSAIAAESRLQHHTEAVAPNVRASDTPQSAEDTQSVGVTIPRAASSKRRNPLQAGWRLVWPGLAMAAAVASVVWMARPFFVPEAGAPIQQMASADPVGGNLPAMRDYVTAHRQIAGPTGVRQASFGASR